MSLADPDITMEKILLVIGTVVGCSLLSFMAGHSLGSARSNADDFARVQKNYETCTTLLTLDVVGISKKQTDFESQLRGTEKKILTACDPLGDHKVEPK